MSASETPAKTPPTTSRRADLGLLALRLTAGGLLAGHGAQKLLGSFGGHGLEGTAGFLESLGFTPGKPWAALAGASEMGGGALTALGLASPVGPIALQGAMATAARTLHWKLPIWNTEGGAEMPLLFSVAGVTLALTGPGRYSVDRTFGLRIPKKLTVLALAGTAAGIAAADRIAARAEAEKARAETAEATATAPSPAPATDDQLIDARPAPGGEAAFDHLSDPFNGLDRPTEPPTAAP